MLKIETLQTFHTEYSADSVEWNQGEYKDYFVVGTYQLEEKDSNVSSNNVRKGRIYLFRYDKDSNILKNCQEIETDAILDQKWKNEKLLVAATSLGKIQCYHFNPCLKLNKVQELNLNGNGEESLALSLDSQQGSSIAIASDSKGRLTLVDLEKAEPIKQWKGHDFEAWTCAFDRYNDRIVYSGGDDSAFIGWDIRMDSLTACKLQISSRDAGVTSFLSYKDNVLLVGSYDEKLCAYDLRNLKRSTHEINLNGGVWRIKPKNNLLLVACMYHNFSIVEYSSDLKLVGEYFEHKSICYGCDWHLSDEDQDEIFASCSFYDRKLSICEVKN